MTSTFALALALTMGAAVFAPAASAASAPAKSQTRIEATSSVAPQTAKQYDAAIARLTAAYQGAAQKFVDDQAAERAAQEKLRPSLDKAVDSERKASAARGAVLKKKMESLSAGKATKGPALDRAVTAEWVAHAADGKTLTKVIGSLEAKDAAKRTARDKTVASERLSYTAKETALNKIVDKIRAGIDSARAAYRRDSAALPTKAARDVVKKGYIAFRDVGESKVTALRTAFAKEKPARDARIDAARNSFANSHEKYLKNRESLRAGYTKDGAATRARVTALRAEYNKFKVGYTKSRAKLDDAYTKEVLSSKSKVSKLRAAYAARVAGNETRLDAIVVEFVKAGKKYAAAFKALDARFAASKG